LPVKMLREFWHSTRYTKTVLIFNVQLKKKPAARSILIVTGDTSNTESKLIFQGYVKPAGSPLCLRVALGYSRLIHYSLHVTCRNCFDASTFSTSRFSTSRFQVHFLRHKVKTDFSVCYCIILTDVALLMEYPCPWGPCQGTWRGLPYQGL